MCSPPGTCANLGLCRVEPQGHPRFDLFSPFIKCRSGNVSRVGSDGEGGKLVCMDEYMQAEGCVIYSLGSNGQFDFEEGVLEVGASLGGCVGGRRAAGRRRRTCRARRHASHGVFN